MKAGFSTGLRVAAWSASSLVLVGAVAGTASAATHHAKNPKHSTAKATTDSGTTGTDTDRPARPQMLHGTATVEKSDGTFGKVASQVGKVTGVSATSITVVSDDEFSATYVIDDSTHIGKAGAEADASDIATGDTVMVQAEQEDGAYTAEAIFDGKPPAGGAGGPGHRGPGGPGGHRGPPPGAPGQQGGGDGDDT